MKLLSRHVVWLVGTVGLVAVAFLVIQKPIQRLFAPSVIREVEVQNLAGHSLHVLFLSASSGDVLLNKRFGPDQRVLLRIYVGDSSQHFDLTNFVVISWGHDGATDCVMLSGRDIETGLQPSRFLKTFRKW